MTNHLETELTQQLDSFESGLRRAALTSLCQLADAGEISVNEPQEIANLHCHSFFSYNGYGYSPTHLAWLGKKLGIQCMGVVDFDVLDAVDEFLDACEVAGVRGTAGIETRVFIPEFKDTEINSPGEPGVCYHMGAGFTTAQVPDAAGSILDILRDRASERNQEMLARINEFLDPLRIQYTDDVLPLTPSGNATERHIVQVLAEKANAAFEDPAAFWAKKLGMETGTVSQAIQDPNQFTNLLRSQLMKRGGVGYVQPTAASFPTVEEFHQIIEACGALPCSAWLDGTSGGEARIEKLLGLLISKGVTAINIVPDRNWNIKNPDDKKIKLENLYHIVEIARQLDLPILVGTEMNKFGQRMVDDFNAPELAPVRDYFMDGAYTMYGHTQLERYWEIGYQSPWAASHFADRKSKNAFFQQAGRLIKPGPKKKSREFLNLRPDAVLTFFKENKGVK